MSDHTQVGLVRGRCCVRVNAIFKSMVVIVVRLGKKLIDTALNWICVPTSEYKESRKVYERQEKNMQKYKLIKI